jgi:hypothetical protein
MTNGVSLINLTNAIAPIKKDLFVCGILTCLLRNSSFRNQTNVP